MVRVHGQKKSPDEEFEKHAFSMEVDEPLLNLAQLCPGLEVVQSRGLQ